MKSFVWAAHLTDVLAYFRSSLGECGSLWCVAVATQVEGIVKSLTTAGDHDRIAGVINILIHDFALSPQANHRKVRRL